MTTVNLVLIEVIAKWLVAVAGGAAVIVAVIKKLLKPVLEPMNGIREKQESIDKFLDRDKKRLDQHEELLGTLKKDNEILLMSTKAIINHLRTSNNTGAMEQLEGDIDRYLIKR